MANDVIWYDSAEVGAPTLNNAAGSLDAVLYACLVTGFNSQTLDSVVVAGGVATATRSAGHGFSDQRIVAIAGAGTSAINGNKLVTVTGANTFTFPASGVADGAISGTITAKRAPLGWLRDQNSGNVSIYKRSDPTATAMGLRVDDSNAGVAAATYARVIGVSAWTDVNTYTDPFPLSSQQSGGFYWHKGVNSTTAKKWLLVGDSKTLYWLSEGAGYPAASYAGTVHGVHAFGDINPFRSGDAYACLCAGGSDTNGNGAGVAVMSNLGSTGGGYMLARQADGVVKSPNAYTIGPAAGARFGAFGPAYPSPVDNGAVIQSPMPVAESNATFNYPLRGTLRGIGSPLANMVSSTGMIQAIDRTLLTNVAGSDRRWLLVAINNASNYGMAAFDVTGPW